MNFLNKTISILFASLAIVATTGCKRDFLETDNLSNLSEQELNSVPAMKASLNAAARQIRGEFFGDAAPMITESLFTEVAVDGTTDKSTNAQDLIARIAPDAQLNDNDYNKVGWYWTEGFKGIRYANSIISAVPKTQFASEAEKNAILGSAYFYRSYFYYRLVNQFGDVPLILKDITTPKADFYSTKREVILTKMKEDLEFAQTWVQDNVNKGEVTKGAVSHLLTKVNLALGDFDAAIISASNIINGGKYGLMTTRFGSTAAQAGKNVVWDLHRMDNKAIAANKEALFLVIDRGNLPQGFISRGSMLMRNAAPMYHNAVVRTPDNKQAISDNKNETIPLTRMYGRGLGRYRGTPYSTKYIWTDNTDYRHAPGMWMEMTDLVYNHPSLKNTPIYNTKLQQWNASNVSTRFTNGAFDTIRHWFGWPHYKIFVNSTNDLAPDEIGNNDIRGGNTDWYVFRVAETYLLRAEAYYWKGMLPEAMADLNKVRDRAKAKLFTDASLITIGTILDERARELYWEEPRKTELTRIAYLFAKTGKAAYNGKTYTLTNFSENNFLYDRVIEKNDFYKNQVPTMQNVRFRIAPYHVLWPIPADAQRFNTQGRINQNKGYVGYENNVAPLDKIE